MLPPAITVSEFLGIINETLGFAYPQVVVEGEVSSFKTSQGKFVFFDLKDDANVLNCFMMVHQLRLPIEDGMKIRVTGSPKVTRFSKFSFTVRSIELAGEGELRRAMELLRAKLEGEGLFEAARKRPLPRYPERIGLITSATSAAYADFIKILSARWGGLDVLVADVSVQGNSAPDQLTDALEYFNTLAVPVDVVALIRGGGSLEDLAAFSHEPVVRAVAASRTPIIVGVGHEIDFSLADYAADVRAATPTDAARLIVPDRTELAAHVAQLERRTAGGVDAAIDQYRLSVDRALSRLEAYLRYPREHVTALSAKLWRSLDGLEHSLSRYATTTTTLQQRLLGTQQRLLAAKRDQITGLTRVLGGFDPQATLERGYAIVRHHSRVVRDPASLKTGDHVMLQLAKGTAPAEIKDKS